MKNTGITYTSAERSPVILPEMAELLPPLSAEQLDALEADLIKNGCYAPIIVNEDMVIIDGHNRQALCEKHDLPYTMAVFSFEDLAVGAGYPEGTPQSGKVGAGQDRAEAETRD